MRSRLGPMVGMGVRSGVSCWTCEWLCVWGAKDCVPRMTLVLEQNLAGRPLYLEIQRTGRRGISANYWFGLTYYPIILSCESHILRQVRVVCESETRSSR